MRRLNQLRHAGYADGFRRLIATSCAALVFVLGLFAASPVLHQQLHHDAHPPADDGCAVVLFAGGVSMPVAAIALPPVPVNWTKQTYVVTSELFVASPRYRLLPAQGPPVA